MNYFVLLLVALFLIGCARESIILQETPAQKAHGEMYMYNPTGSPFTFVIDSPGEYHNLTDLSAGYLLGFTFTDETELNGGSYLTAQTQGEYKICSSMSFSSSANGGLYGISASKNFDHTITRNCYTRREASGDVGNAGLCCFVHLDEGDTLSLKVENENNNRDILLHTINLNAVLI